MPEAGAPARRANLCAVAWTLVQADGTAATEAVDLDDVKARLASGEHFWLDIGHPTPERARPSSASCSSCTLSHATTSAVFGQRAKADDYPGHTLLVLFGATHDADSLVEVHAVVAEGWLLTVHTENCPAFIDLRARTMRGRPAAGRRRR